ncbi:MAG: 4Fe-4S dicluster domain-containing protein [Pirellulales bacterium]
MHSQQILDCIRTAGVVGAGGAGFPTYRKLEASVDQIIINGAECEPLLTKDREVMLREGEALLRGIDVIAELTGAERITLAVKQKNRDVLDLLGPGLRKRGYHSFVSDDVYPSGDEYVLVYDITGRQIPPGGIPPQVGCLVDNVETILNVAHAVEGEPVTRKWLTVTGAVAQPITTIVPVGTSLEDCIDLAGGATTDEPLVLTGGLMMGGVTTDLTDPVTKTIGGVIVLPQNHYLARRKTASQATYTRIGHGQCDQCSLCTELCPRYLLGYPIEPHRVMRTLLMTGAPKEQGSLWAQYCCECNICSFIACPESLDPKSICVDAKQVLREKGIGRDEAELEQLFRPPHPARKGREVPIATLYQRLGLTPYNRTPEFVAGSLSPKSVRIRLDTHIGQPAEPQVRPGDRVVAGSVLADVPPKGLGCAVHASIDGRVVEVTKEYVQIDAAG